MKVCTGIVCRPDFLETLRDSCEKSVEFVKSIGFDNVQLYVKSNQKEAYKIFYNLYEMQTYLTDNWKIPEVPKNVALVKKVEKDPKSSK